jgi:hypothetical protein
MSPPTPSPYALACGRRAVDMPLLPPMHLEPLFRSPNPAPPTLGGTHVQAPGGCSRAEEPKTRRLEAPLGLVSDAREDRGGRFLPDRH